MQNLIPYVIESTPNGERSYDIFSRMLKDRIIMLDGGIGEYTAGSICSQLLFLEQQDPEADISIYINSPGGYVTVGMAIYDTMQLVKPDVSTIVFGQAASMGSLLAAGGAPGKRYILPNARHMIHQPLGGTYGQATDVEIQAKELLRWKDVLTSIYKKHTKQTLKTLKADMERDNFMTAKQAVAYGLADKILTNR